MRICIILQLLNGSRIEIADVVKFVYSTVIVVVADPQECNYADNVRNHLRRPQYTYKTRVGNISVKNLAHFCEIEV